MGSANREFVLDMPPREAFDRVLAAMGSIGRVVECWQTTMSAVGTTRYGTQRAELLVSVVAGGDGSIVQIRAAGEDIWGAGARKGAENLIRALDPRWSHWSLDSGDE